MIFPLYSHDIPTIFQQVPQVLRGGDQVDQVMRDFFQAQIFRCSFWEEVPYDWGSAVEVTAMGTVLW